MKITDMVDLETRDVVWSMDEEFTRPVDDSKWLRKYDDMLHLDPGMYTLYYHACRPFFFESNFLHHTVPPFRDGILYPLQGLAGIILFAHFS